jgi:hypothetical protein
LWKTAASRLPARLSVGGNYAEQLGGSRYHLVGEVTNQANGTASYVKISAAFTKEVGINL